MSGEPSAGAPAPESAPAGAIPPAPVRGPAYGRTQRVLATLIVLAVLWGLVRAALEPGMGAVLWLAPAILVPYGFMLTAATTIDADGLRQSGLLMRRLRWDEIAQARVGRTPLACTLLVRTIRGRFVRLRGGTPQLRAAFERVAAAFPLR